MAEGTNVFFLMIKERLQVLYDTSSRSPTQNSTGAEAHCPRFLVAGHPKPIDHGASLSYGGPGPYNSGGIIWILAGQNGPAARRSWEIMTYVRVQAPNYRGKNFKNSSSDSPSKDPFGETL